MSKGPMDVHDGAQDDNPDKIFSHFTQSQKSTSMHHHRALTEDHRRPSLVKLRSRSNTSTSSNGLVAPSKLSTPDIMQNSGKHSPSAEHPRSPTVIKSDKQDSFRRLKAKSSRLFKRPESSDELTSLAPLKWSDEFDDICPKVAEDEFVQPASRQSRKGSKGNA